MQSRLLGYISGIVGRTAADDVLQDVFLQIYRNLKWLRDPDLFVPWAYRIASRASFECLRRERRYSSADEQTLLLDELASPPEPGLQLFCGVPELLEEISPNSRAVLNLHYVQDLSIDEVAAILDIGVGTAKSRLAYGLSCLRKICERKQKTMTNIPTDVLRNSLNQVDRERRRATLLLYLLVALTLAFWIAMMFSKDDHKGLPFGLAAVMGSVYVAGMMASKASSDNTRTILKALELLSSDTQSSRSE